ncbi:MAG: hypothetical protein PHO30_07695, partial [Candidatus Omnitrophica bacterium]|nr:hypothetical protein [Candidatus Omnitrophota bacterium]
STTYNELGSKRSMNQYDGNGFVSATVNYGENGRTLGKLLYDSTGRPDVAVNHKGATTTEYMYNEFGQLEQTISYQNGIQTSYTTFDVYSKAQNTYQMYTATSPNYASDGTYEGNAGGGTQFTSGGTANYTVNSDGTISGGALLQSNKYTSFGAVEQTSSYGRSGTVTSYTKYDDHGRATEVWNTKGEGAKVQDYTYSAQGFLAYTTSYAEMKSFDDEGNPVSDGTWDSSQVTRTYFNELGQQIETYNMTKNSDGTYTQGGRVSLYQYNENGFLSQIRSYSDNTETGLTICDATGRQIIQYNPERNVVARFWYDANGFMYRSTQYAQEE